MNEIERYDFDLNGYLLLKGALDKDSTRRCLAAADALEKRVEATIDCEPHFVGHFGLRYHYDEEAGCSSCSSNHGGGGIQYVVDDFLNADPSFDVLVNHEPVMKYLREMIAGPGEVSITSSEMRFRHRGNITGSHMGGPIDARNQYRFVGREMLDPACGSRVMKRRDFDMLTVRVLYALHDLPEENGPLCVVPGSHKANFPSPHGADPLKEPGMIPLPMEAGDVMLFTENLRHGGWPNAVDRTRKTAHLCFSASWMGSQSPAHWNGQVHVTEAAWQRYNEAQRALLPPPSPSLIHGSQHSAALIQHIQGLRQQISALTERNAELERQLKGSRGPIALVLSRFFR
jgi:hypothetical protein